MSDLLSESAPLDNYDTNLKHFGETVTGYCCLCIPNVRKINGHKNYIIGSLLLALTSVAVKYTSQSSN